MKWLLGFISLCWFSITPATAQGCCHHDHHCDDCPYHGHCYHHPASANWSNNTANLQTLEGTVAEVVYLPGATAGSGNVEVRLTSGGQTELVRLAPSAFLKQSGLVLREGDAITIKGFAVSGMEGDLIVATEVHKGDKNLALRDMRGQPVWPSY